MTMLTDVKIVRLEGSEGEPTLGAVVVNNHLFCTSLELPDYDNNSDISRIPAGVYEAILTYSPTFKKELYRLSNVPDRIGVLIHSGNTVENTKGCILLGQYPGKLPVHDENLRAVLNSGNTLKKFHEKCETEIMITIIDMT